MTELNNRQETLEYLDRIIQSNIVSDEQKLIACERILDTYAMEFLKECLPERMKEEKIDLYNADNQTIIVGEEWNACIDQILSNKDKK